MQIGFPAALTLLFVALKLTHVIDWEWLWVLSPLWISVLIGVGLFLLWIVGVVLAAAFGASRQSKRRGRLF